MNQPNRQVRGEVVAGWALVGLAALVVWTSWPADSGPTDTGPASVRMQADAAGGSGKPSPRVDPHGSHSTVPARVEPVGAAPVDASGMVLPPSTLPPIPAPAPPMAQSHGQAAPAQIPALPEDAVVQTQGWVSASDSRIAQQLVWQRISTCVGAGQGLAVQFGVAGGRGSSELYQPQWQGVDSPGLARCLATALQGLRLPVATDTQGTVTLQFGPAAAARPDWQALW